ncbi:MAG: AmmeMemoRadiSam system protein B [Desulfurococcales archaeon]|nr:AmmeMemoRadiSam system protein B [Desulfurococcales archaeon]
MKVRLPAHAGTFYPATRDDVVKAIEDSFKHPVGPGRLPERGGGSKPLPIAYVAPHAGYMYSGPVAAHVYYDLSTRYRPETVIIVGPNHTGLGLAASVWSEGYWRTPLGDVEVDSEAAKELAKRTALIAPDEEAHIYEHSVEVQIPFLQYVLGEDFKIVPVVVLHQTLDASLRIARAYISMREELYGDKILLLATSDLNHYEPYDVTVEKDLKVLEAAETGDPESLWNTIERLRVSACGPTPLTAAVASGKIAGGRVKVLKYANSGDVTGEKAWVVGYPAVLVDRS